MHICRVGQNQIYTVYIRYFWLGNHQTYGVYIRTCTVLANPTHMAFAVVKHACMVFVVVLHTCIIFIFAMHTCKGIHCFVTHMHGYSFL